MLVCPKCGGQKFTASQTCVCDIIVDSDNEFLENNTENNSVYISWADPPYGPYCCTNCGVEYNDIEKDLVEQDDLVGRCVRCIHMHDAIGLEGAEGTIAHVDDAGQIHVVWDNGSKLFLVQDLDKYKILDLSGEEEEEEEEYDVPILLKNISFDDLSKIREFLNQQEIEAEEL